MWRRSPSATTFRSRPELPIDPKLAAGIDKGMIELFNGDWLDKIADAVYELPARAGK